MPATLRAMMQPGESEIDYCLMKHPQMPQWLDGLDKQLSEYGGAIAVARREMVESLNAQLASFEDGLFASPLIQLENAELRSEEELLDALRSNRR